jgi:hypothetical protein
MNQLTPLKPKSSEAIIIGDGPSKYMILEHPKFCNGRDVAIINKVGLQWPYRCRFWITYHAEWVARWYAQRSMKGYPLPLKFIVSANKRHDLYHVPHFNVTQQVHGLNTGGTSSLLAAIVLLDMGYKLIHLFGVDLTQSYRKDRKFWRILEDKPLLFHGDDWFHTKRFSED